MTPAGLALLTTDVPVIAAVNGPAVGWGMELALMCDLRVASERARFGALFVLRGLCCDVAGLARLASLVGREKASELLSPATSSTRPRRSASGSYRGSFPTPSSCRPRWHSPTRSRPIRRSPWPRSSRAPPRARSRLGALGAWVSGTLAELFTTADHQEGVRAFLEKRPPRFVGK